ncbi:HsdR family type I site-specific deoxyribonuclease [Alphaproteobacteria bacterium]|nr:HsdR family type I site-specific deoxyribonuclease [Alphaproteobacteria bacterium]
MSRLSQPEIMTQRRLIDLFTSQMGYDYLGDWRDRDNNSNIEEELLSQNLALRGYSQAHISRAIDLLKRAATDNSKSLYQRNQDTYNLLRYGVQVKVDASKPTETIHLIDWKNPQSNQFALAEEVTLRGNMERRPDLVFYINGIAVGVLELKRSKVAITEGIRQSISNQQLRFNEWFYPTVQFVMAGSDAEGLRYGTVGTPEPFFLTWKEDETQDDGYKLDKYLGKMFEKSRLLELTHDFVLFDGGMKKLPRVHQYFGIKAAQAHVSRHEGGIIWHTQGSGKSIVMVLLAKWILEKNPNARVVIITDRDELDKQIEGVFADVGEQIERATSGRDLLTKLSQPTPRLLCSLVHKFGKQGVEDFEAYIKQLKQSDASAFGDIFVLVDECHRTQSGKLHRIMKAQLPNATFIGFTGTPLLKVDKQTTMEVFGGYIHRYLFTEAVDDGVILDLAYEARDVDQELGSQSKIDQWFEAKTRGLNDWQKAALKKQWGTLQTVLSSKSRMSRVVNDIIHDFAIKPRLFTERGNAILVAGSIFEAVSYYRLFNQTEFNGRCAVVTSYNPHGSDISREDTGAVSETDKETIFRIYEGILEHVDAKPGKTKTETYEDEVKKLFIKEPWNMKLLIVVDKLLTGFDAPSCSYLYIDKKMQDHGLFQAICRTNRLDGEDKDYGYIVDYKDLFTKVENAIAVYAEELDHVEGQPRQEINVQDRLKLGRSRLDTALEAIEELCEPVEPPKEALNYIRYFCGNSELVGDLEATAQKRQALYQLTAAVIRAFANIANDMEAAGYNDFQIRQIKSRVEHFKDARDIVKNASGEYLDLKAYEADMRKLIDTYIEAKEPRPISDFESMSLVELIVKSGAAKAISERLASTAKTKEGISETVENNIRSVLLKGQLNDPVFFEKMSNLLDQIIKDRKSQALDYEAYLVRIAELAKQVQQGGGNDVPASISTPELRALYNNMGENEEMAVRLHQHLVANIPDGWRGVGPREQRVKQAIFAVVNDKTEVQRLFQIIKQQAGY